VNFANADMVGHTGVYTAIESAVKVIDQCLNVAPSILHIMGLEQPKEMTGKCLIMAEDLRADAVKQMFK
jgi:bisphosphoglycerate-independent phosphoglycerate mutase (AlkP superfamily)